MKKNDRRKSTDNKTDIHPNIDDNIQFLKSKFINCTDVIYRNMYISDTKVYIMHISGLTDNNMIMEEVLEKLLLCRDIIKKEKTSIEKIACEIPVTEIAIIDDLETCTYEIINGNILILIDNNTKAISISLNKYSNKDEPVVEPALLGPKESFTVSLNNNEALVRRYLNNEDCKILKIKLGKAFPKKSSIIYLESVADKNTVDEVIKRIRSINLDIVIDASNLAELIEDNQYSPFPTIAITERIDKAVAGLLEGQIVLLLDNSSFALVLPSVFISFFQSAEDYYNRFYLASFLRGLRVIAFFVSIFLPGFYTAITLFNQELIPTKLLISIANQTAITPFSSTIELILMLFAFELLRELGVRLPKGVGSTVSLVGALIIGDTVVRAGLVSTSVVIVTAFTAISSMILPSIQLYEGILVFRIITLFFGGTLGFWGIIISLLFLISHLCTLKTFGVPYMYSIVNNNVELDDTVSRVPLRIKNQKTLFKRKNKLMKKY